jgi:8-oxo-dGTP pyrophosphatase MutT (NUDIX family)
MVAVTSVGGVGGCRSKQLLEAIPKIKSLYQKGLSKEFDNAFPLFTPKAHRHVWKTVPINNERQAAVLVPLVDYNNKISLLFTTRSSELPTHASEVSFPGGHFDTTVDQTLEDTAIREAQEELLGDDKYPWQLSDGVEIIGKATPLPSIKGTPVTPVIAVLPYKIDDTTFPGCPGEVQDVFCVSLEELLEVETTEPSERFQGNIPVFYSKEGDKKIWGLTAVVCRSLLHKLFKPVFFP